MAEPARSGNGRVITPRPGAFGNAAVTARQQFAGLWSRESLLRLGLALVLATALWLYVTNRQSPTQTWEFGSPLPINPEGVPSGLTVTNNLPLVRVQIRANRNTTQVTSTSFHTFVDLSGYHKGERYAKVSVVADPGIQVVKIIPSRVRVNLDTVAESHVPVRLHVVSSPPSGYTPGGIVANPNTVVVTGPEAAVSQVTQAVVFIDLSGSRTTVKGIYPVTPADRRGSTVANRSISIQPQQVQVTVPITSPSKFRTLPVVPALIGRPKGDLGVVSVTASPANVTIYGAPGQLGSAGSILTAPISIARRGAGTITRTVTLRVPRGIKLNTYRVTVSVTVGASSSSTSTSVQVVPLNPPPGLVVRLRPDHVLVTSTGTSTSLQAAIGHIRAALNLAGFGLGTYHLAPSLSLPFGLSLVSTYPSQITVVLTPAR